MHGCAYWIEIIDISDPSQPFKSGSYFDTLGEPSQLVIEKDTAYIGDSWNVNVAHINPDGGLEKLVDYQLETTVDFLQLDQGKLYLGGYNSIEILDVSNPADITRVAKYTSPTYAIKSGQIKLPFIYAQVKLIDGLSDAVSMLVFDVTDPNHPILVNDTAYSNLNIQPVFKPNQIYLDGDRMYVTSPTGGGDFFRSRVLEFLIFNSR